MCAGCSGGDKDPAEAMEEHPPAEVPEEMLDNPESIHPATALKHMFSDVPDDVIDYVLEASGGNLDKAAAGLWLMKVMQSFAKAGWVPISLFRTHPRTNFDFLTAELADEFV